MEKTARRVHVGLAADFQEGDRKLVELDGLQIGVFRVDGRFVAYENKCAHQGGPVCDGQFFPEMQGELDEEGRFVRERANYAVPHLVCPWHSWEYDLRTGEMVVLRNIRLRSFETVEDGGELYVIA